MNSGDQKPDRVPYTTRPRPAGASARSQSASAWLAGTVVIVAVSAWAWFGNAPRPAQPAQEPQASSAPEPIAAPTPVESPLPAPEAEPALPAPEAPPPASAVEATAPAPAARVVPDNKAIPFTQGFLNFETAADKDGGMDENVDVIVDGVPRRNSRLMGTKVKRTLRVPVYGSNVEHTVDVTYRVSKRSHGVMKHAVWHDIYQHKPGDKDWRLVLRESTENGVTTRTNLNW